MLKILIVGRRRAGMTVAELHRYMVDVHGAAVVRSIAEQPGLTPRRYVQNHVVDATFRVSGAAPDPFSVARDFVTQVWFDNPAQARASLEAPFYLEQLRPDEDRFVDQASVVKLPVRAEPLHGPGDDASHDASGGTGGAGKLFVFHQAAAGAAPDALTAVTAQLWNTLLPGDGHGIRRVVRNHVLRLPPGQPVAADLVDEAWLDDDDAARRLAARWHGWADDADGPLGAQIAPGSCFCLLAREKVMFAGMP